MKILHVLASNTYNGAENVVCQIIEMFKDDPDCEMLYCSPDGDIRKALYKRGVDFIPIKKLLPSEIKDIIAREKPDIIHAHDRKASLVCALAKGNTRLISHMHNNPAGARKLSSESIGYLYAAQKAECVIWVSQEAYEEFYFKKKLETKSVVLENVISADRVRRLAEEDKNTYSYDVVFVGRMVYQKNPERFVRIVKNVSEDFPGVKAAMAGTGELEEDVKTLIDDIGMADHIDFLGYMDNPYKLIKSGKVLLLPSRWEGLPMVQLEAEALGTYVVRTPGTDDELADRVKTCLKSEKQDAQHSDAWNDYKTRLAEIYAG